MQGIGLGLREVSESLSFQFSRQIRAGARIGDIESQIPRDTWKIKKGFVELHPIILASINQTLKAR